MFNDLTLRVLWWVLIWLLLIGWAIADGSNL
jgi:cytochrome bd-type quinol oxidase subunit 2